MLPCKSCICLSRQRFQSCAAPLVEEVMSGQTPGDGIVQLMAWRTTTHRLTVSDLTEGPLVPRLSDIPSLFPLLFPGKQSSAWSWYLCETAMPWRKTIYKIRVISARMGCLEKSSVAGDKYFNIRKLPEHQLKEECGFSSIFWWLPWVSGITAAILTVTHCAFCVALCSQPVLKGFVHTSSTSGAVEPLQREKTLFTWVLKWSLLKKEDIILLKFHWVLQPFSV